MGGRSLARRTKPSVGGLMCKWLNHEAGTRQQQQPDPIPLLLAMTTTTTLKVNSINKSLSALTEWRRMQVTTEVWQLTAHSGRCLDGREWLLFNYYYYYKRGLYANLMGCELELGDKSGRWSPFTTQGEWWRAKLSVKCPREGGL